MTKRVVNIGKGTGQDQFIRVEAKSGCVKFNEFLTSKIEATKKMIILAGGGSNGKSSDTGQGAGGGAGGTTGSGTVGGGVHGVKGVTPSSKHHCQSFMEIMRVLLARLDKLLHPKAKRVPKARSAEYIAKHKADLEKAKEFERIMTEIDKKIRDGTWNPYIHSPDFIGGIDELTEFEKATGWSAGAAVFLTIFDYEAIEAILMLPF